MTRTMLRAKIHRIRVTECDVEYEGSLSLDPLLMEAAGMVPYERIDVYNVDNANRFSTYLIEGRPGSGDCCVNGAAAHLVSKGHKLIICTFTELADEDVQGYQPGVVLIGEGNRITSVKRSEQAFTRVDA